MRTVCIDIQWLQCGRIEVLGLFFRIHKVMNHLLQSTETDTVLHHLKTNKSRKDRKLKKYGLSRGR